MFKKIAGGFFGLAVGDALGAPLEFMSAEEIETKYGRVDSMLGGGWLNLIPGQVTDDTTMALCVSRGIVANYHEPIEVIGEEFVKWYRTNPSDIGNSCRNSIAMYLKIGDWFTASQMAHKQLGRSGGNGSLMRTLPIALAYRDNIEQMLELTESVSKMTHWENIAHDACKVYNRLAHAYLKGDTEKEALIKRCLRQFSSFHDLLDLKSVPPSGYVRDSLYHALQSFIKTDNFHDCLIRAINLGGDTDSIGAIAGGLAGVFYGIDSIPLEWKKGLDGERYDEILHLSQQISKIQQDK